jgi:exopolysaccharide biosynthesis polyprenyl glycosylphosphotransferase
MRNHLFNLYIGRVIGTVVADAFCFVAASALAYFLLEPPFPLHIYAAATILGAFGCFVALFYCGAYGLSVLGSGRQTLSSIIGVMGLASIAALVVYFAIHTPPRAVDTMAHVAVFYFPLLLGERFLFRLVSSLPRLSKRVLVVGTSDLAASIARSMHEHSGLGSELVGFLSDEPLRTRDEIEGVPILGNVHEVEKIVDRERIGTIVVASKSRSEYFPEEELLAAKLRGWRVESGVSFYEHVTGRVYLRDLRRSYLIFGTGFRQSWLSSALKRGLDVTAAATGLLVAAPLLAFCALAIRLDSKGPILYRQVRIGQHNRPFEVLKLRSMKHDAEAETGPVWSSRTDARITRVGRILRKARFDEVPQLWNVLRNDMSLVGPRPERPEFVEMLCERYPYFRLRTAAKPGITGWAQIRHGYVNDIATFEEKLALDVYYLKHRSIAMDLLILWKTAKTVILLGGA